MLDAILDNQTELDIVEHTTDTAGYTEMVFALFDLLGLRFSPRIKDLPDQRLYRPNKQVRYRTLEPLLKGTVRTAFILQQYDDLLRLAGSLKSGWVTASLLMSKLQSYPRQNVLTRALVEHDCLVKTHFILRYLLSEKMRSAINRQLNKGESLYSLRRFLFFANEGNIRQSQDESQVNQVGCLNFVKNAVVLWTIVYMHAICKKLEQERYPTHEEDLRHLSPAQSENINPYGNYEFNIDVEFTRENIRPLRSE